VQGFSRLGSTRPPRWLRASRTHSPVASPPASASLTELASVGVAASFAIAASFPPASIPDTQTPAAQLSPEAQANVAPQPPQLLLSSMVLTHAAPQSSGYAALLQDPPQTGGAPAQVAVPWVGGVHGAHVVPHEPREVELSFTQVPVQSCMPAGQAQVEFSQTFPPVQACEAPSVLQAPQFFESVRVSVSHPVDARPSQFA
jgi:hypothetical protein